MLVDLVDDRRRPDEEDLVLLAIAADLQLRLGERQELAFSRHLRECLGLVIRIWLLFATSFFRIFNCER